MRRVTHKWSEEAEIPFRIALRREGDHQHEPYRVSSRHLLYISAVPMHERELSFGVIRKGMGTLMAFNFYPNSF